MNSINNLFSKHLSGVMQFLVSCYGSSGTQLDIETFGYFLYFPLLSI